MAICNDPRIGPKSVHLQVAPTPSERYALEEKWKLTEATDSQRSQAVALGLVNIVGVFVLGYLLSSPGVAYDVANSGFAIVLSAFPLLLVCTLMPLPEE